MWLWADFSLAVDGRLCWRSGQRLISFDCGLSLAGAATTIIFAATKVLSRQTGVCRDKARLLSRQAFLSRKTYFITKIFSRDKSYVPASIFLSRQKTCFVATNACLSWKKLLLWQKWCLWQLPPMIVIDWRPLATGSRRCWRSGQRLISFGCGLASFSHGQQTLLA